ncbi:pilus assembly PilX N-terminal domain-containing protein [Candidatus Daviesbacteria bacterium]|nr:pilus assembly PilX N-terminal domain-containing protein [Candidatus Daviesbacteria bacterium]
MKIHQTQGQTILILLLVMSVALALGVSIIQRSLTDVATSTKVEQSTRAFYTAEAGIERALTGDSTGVTFSDNNSQAIVFDSGLLPAQSTQEGQAGQALEYPPVSKEDIAQVWLANPSTNPMAPHYRQSSLDIYWGEQNINTTDSDNMPAIAIVLIYEDQGEYKASRFYLDSDFRRIESNGFRDATIGSGSCGNISIETSMGPGRRFYCKYTLTDLPLSMILLRARMLYNKSNQPFAVGPKCVNDDPDYPNDCSLPPQARVITSIGVSGETERRVQLFKLDKVVPPYFDYAIFSAGEISK